MQNKRACPVQTLTFYLLGIFSVPTLCYALDTGDKGVRDRHGPHPRVADMLVRETDSTTDTQDHFRHGGVPGKTIKEEGYG